MKRNLFLSLLLVIVVGLSALFQLQPVAAKAFCEPEINYVYLPVILNSFSTNTSIVVDHRHTDISQIPDEWIEAAKQYVVHYAHTSHGSQILSGLRWLEQQDPKYNVDIKVSNVLALPTDTTALGFYDGNNYSGTTYITPEMYWETQDGINHTRSVVSPGSFDFSLWTWCGQMSYYSSSQVQTYLDIMSQFENDYPSTRFILYTGHTDGSTPTSGSALWRNNNLVRTYAADNNKLLFDFADIESYDPDGNFYPNATDGCSWCDDWCDANPTAFECQNLPSCAHTDGLQCTLKAQAFWHLMARMAGWDGNPTP